MAPLTVRWIVGSVIFGSVVSFMLAWLLTRSGVLDPHRLDLLLVGCASLSLNLVVIPGLYWWDKRRARLGSGQRIPEVVLHTFAFAGGAPAALVCMRLLHHKTRKGRFVVTTWIALAVNLGLAHLGREYFGFV